MSNREQLIRSFAEAINNQDVSSIGEYMHPDHRFVDAHGNSVAGRDQMLAGWKMYFSWFPDYSVEIKDIIEKDNILYIFGQAGGTWSGKTPGGEDSWRVPAAWKAEVKDDKIIYWQVFADTYLPFKIIEKYNKS